MRLIFLFLVYFFIANYSNCQVIGDIDEKTTPNGEIWVLDSTHFYNPGLFADVYLSNRQIVTSRDSEGRLTSKLYFSRESESGDWVKKFKVFKSYHENGKINEYFLRSFDSSRNIWIDSIQYKKFNNKGLNILSIAKVWNFQTVNFTYGNKSFFKYNSDGRTISNLSQKWNAEDETWVNSKWNVTSYTGTESIEEIYKIWSEEVEEWINSKKIKKDFDDNGLLLETITSLWKNGDWQNSYRKSIVYTADKMIGHILNQVWDSNINNWVNYLKVEYEYDGKLRIKEINQVWDQSNGKWFDSSISKSKFEEKLLVEKEIRYYYQDTSLNDAGEKYFYQYNSDKKVIVQISQLWDAQSGIWVNNRKWNYIYDSGKTTITSIWDVEREEWINALYYKYILNVEGYTIFTIRKYWKEDNWVNSHKSEREYDDFNHLVIDKSFVYDSDIADWKLNNKSVYFWSKFLTAVSEVEFGFELELFPNPVSDILLLKIKNISERTIAEVINSDGNIVSALNLKPTGGRAQIDVSQLDKGIYFLKLLTDSWIVSKPFVVNR